MTAPEKMSDEQIGDLTKHIRGVHCRVVDEIARAIESARDAQWLEPSAPAPDGRGGTPAAEERGAIDAGLGG